VLEPATESIESFNIRSRPVNESSSLRVSSVAPLAKSFSISTSKAIAREIAKEKFTPAELDEEEQNLERLQRWREACPELVIRSTFIAGFPGETEAEFEHLLGFMREAQIDRAGCFAYSAVDGATANELPGMLPTELREERRARFMAVAEAVSTAKLQRRVGATMQVLIDSAPALGRKGGVGRSYADAPEIDGSVRLLPPEKASKVLRVGEFTRVRIIGTQGHDLIGQPI